MHATVKINGRCPPAIGFATSEQITRPSRAEAETAVRTLIRWAGDDPDREGLTRHAGPRRPRL